MMDEPVLNAHIERKKSSFVSVIFMQLSLLFTVALIASNIFETKQISLGLFNITGGLLIFPVCYIINDCVCEVWGYKRATLLIWMGFLLNFLFIGVAAICDLLPGADYWTNQEGFHAIFGLSARITVASCLAFLAGSFINSMVLSRMKVRSEGKRLGGRLIVSSIAGEVADSIIFFPIAFLGVLSGKELIDQMLMQFILKTLYEIIFLPVTIRVIRGLKKMEGEDVYDRDISYGIFDVFKRERV